MKKCMKCNETKPLIGFHSNRSKSDGVSSECRDCANSYSRKYRMENIDYFRGYAKSRSTDQSIRGSMNLSARKWRAENPKKRKAQLSISSAIQRGRIKPQPCFTCGDEKTQAHHSHYDLPMAVTWLCIKHHTQLHREFREFIRQ